jgi:hypothetical protein
MQARLDRPVRAGRGSGQQGFDKIRNRNAERVLLPRVQMDAVGVAGSGMLGGVQVMAAEHLGDISVVLVELLGLLRRTGEDVRKQI